MFDGRLTVGAGKFIFDFNSDNMNFWAFNWAAYFDDLKMIDF